MDSDNKTNYLPMVEHHESMATHVAHLISIFYKELISSGITDEQHIIRITEAWIYANFGGDCEP